MFNPIPKQVVGKFLRLNDRTPIGLVAAIKDGNSVLVGWSFTRKGDKFNRKVAWSVAIGRAKVGTLASVPRALQPIVDEIRDRASRYFRVAPENVFGPPSEYAPAAPELVQGAQCCGGCCGSCA
jgi:hypothetical protein